MTYFLPDLKVSSGDRRGDQSLNARFTGEHILFRFEDFQYAGFSLDMVIYIPADEPKALERLCR